jgi:cytochrome c biogenesis protein CcdA/thiol-disulfide isomerase/thioredoxin
MIILLLFSLFAGAVTVLSPCILPVLPIILSSATTKGKARPLGVITGLIISFSFFTLAVSKIISLLGISANVLRLAAVIIIAILGLVLVLPVLGTWFDRAVRFLPGIVKPRSNQASGFWPGILTGASLGLVWAPCAGPILAAITALAATQTINLATILVVVSYAIGAGIPLLAIAYGGRALINRVPFLSRNSLRIQQIFGVAMILVAALIAFNVDTLVTTWLTEAIPASWTNTLQAFESSSSVTNQLSILNPNNKSKPVTPASHLQDLGPAPELAGITNWINSVPLTLQSLQGHVVLIDFWTYSCVNCIRTLPYLEQWYAKYKDAGFVIIGVHTPEFAFEHDPTNVEMAVKRFGILYPVAQDNNYATWDAYNNLYWPADYLIDASGHLRYAVFGEGNYSQTEQVIQQLLEAAGQTVPINLVSGAAAPFTPGETPETYIGTSRENSLASPEPLVPGQSSTYTLPSVLPLNQFAVSGNWNFQPEYAQVTQADGLLVLHFYAKDVYLVMRSNQPTTVTLVSVSPTPPSLTEDVGTNGMITVDTDRLYHLLHFDLPTEGTVTLQFNNAGVQVYSFTFGG